MPPTGLFPRLAPRSTSSAAEKKLWRALVKHLPEGWTAWHSMRVRAPRGRDGEADFVFAVPGRGAFVLEVKGGQVEVRDGRWLQDGRELHASPRDQAFEYITVLKRQIADRHPLLAQPFIAVATAFPDTEWDTPPTNGDLVGTVLGEQDLAFLRDALLALADRLFNARPPPEGPWIEALHELWGESWVPELSLGSRTRLSEARRVELDATQIESIHAVDANLRMFVSGPPGTGKTLLAVEVARRWASRGRKPVLLCFTRALAADLRAGGHDAWTARELAAEVLARAGVVLEGGAPSTDWSAQTWHDVPQRALEALPRSPLAYDAVVVDEAQDFAADDWAFVRAIAGAGPLWAFGDEGQGFWADRREVPADVRPFVYTLGTRYRCPAALAAFADRYRTGTAPAAAAAPFDELRVVVAPADGLAEACGREIAALTRGGVRADQIALLSLAGQTKTTLGAAARIGELAAVRADDPAAAESLVTETFLRFKGLERPWVLVTELGLASTSYDVRMHIALTRATVGCIVVATADEVASDPRLAALVRSDEPRSPAER